MYIKWWYCPITYIVCHLTYLWSHWYLNSLNCITHSPIYSPIDLQNSPNPIFKLNLTQSTLPYTVWLTDNIPIHNWSIKPKNPHLPTPCNQQLRDQFSVSLPIQLFCDLYPPPQESWVQVIWARQSRVSWPSGIAHSKMDDVISDHRQEGLFRQTRGGTRRHVHPANRAGEVSLTALTKFQDINWPPW